MRDWRRTSFAKQEWEFMASRFLFEQFEGNISKDSRLLRPLMEVQDFAENLENDALFVSVYLLALVICAIAWGCVFCLCDSVHVHAFAFARVNWHLLTCVCVFLFISQSLSQLEVTDVCIRSFFLRWYWFARPYKLIRSFEGIRVRVEKYFEIWKFSVYSFWWNHIYIAAKHYIKEKYGHWQQ